MKKELDSIRRVASRSGDDWLSFEVGGAKEIIEHEGDQIVYDAYRVPVQAQIGGKDFGSSFHFDISVGEKLFDEPERVRGTDLFDFVGIKVVEHRVYPRETHVAEKLHAWSLPRARPNSRVKDLVDLGLMANGLEFEFGVLREAIHETFEFRSTHPVPEEIPDVPESWPEQYRRLESENPLPWDSIDQLLELTETFLKPVLTGDAEVLWDPAQAKWRTD